MFTKKTPALFLVNSVVTVSLKTKLSFLFILFLLVIIGFSYVFVTDKYKAITSNEQLLEEVNFILPYSYLISSSSNERGKINSFLAGNIDAEKHLPHAFKQRELDINNLPKPKGRLQKLYGKNIELVFNELVKLEKIKEQALADPTNQPLRLKLFKQYSAVNKQLNAMNLIFKYSKKNFELSKLSDHWNLQQKLTETLAKERGLVYGLFFSKQASNEEKSLLTFYRISQQELLDSLRFTQTKLTVMVK